jgi:hypothetical protein
MGNKQAKPRRQFGALAATAISGAILGAGATLALLHFQGPLILGGIPDERIAALNARIDAAEGKTAAASAAAAAARAALAEVENRAAAAESAAANAAEAASQAKAEAQKAAAAEPAPQAGAPGGAQAEAPDLGPLEARVASLEQKLASFDQQLAAPKAALRAEPEQESTAAKQASGAQAVAVVAGSLLRKLDSGGEFSSDLKALEGLGVPQDSLAPLRAIPGTAVLSEKQLASQFAGVAPKILASEAENPGGVPESFLDRMSRHAKALVRVHRAGDADSGGVQGLTSRIENALKTGDLETALMSWQELPAHAQSVSQEWGQAAKARLDALRAARAIEASAVAALAKPKP